jgi:hypothetical protein
MVSSVITGLEAERDAAVSAAKIFGHEVLRSEDIGASAETPQRACLDLVRRSDAVVLILGDRYGTVPPGRELAPTHEEYREARELGRAVLAYTRAADPEPRQHAFISEVRSWTAGAMTEAFSTPEELRDLVIRGLRGLELARAAGGVDAQEMLTRAREALRAVYVDRNEPSLGVAVALGPAQQVLRPRQLSEPDFQRDLERDALYGETPVLLRGRSVQTSVVKGRLVLRQEQAMLALGTDGTTAVSVPAVTERDHFAVLIEEDVVELVRRAVHFAGQLIDQLDPTGRVTDVVPVAGIAHVGFAPWMKRAERARAQSSYAMNIHAPDTVEVALEPAHRRRRALTADATTIAEDMTDLMRQQVVE